MKDVYISIIAMLLTTGVVAAIIYDTQSIYRGMTIRRHPLNKKLFDVGSMLVHITFADGRKMTSRCYGSALDWTNTNTKIIQPVAITQVEKEATSYLFIANKGRMIIVNDTLNPTRSMSGNVAEVILGTRQPFIIAISEYEYVNS